MFASHSGSIESNESVFKDDFSLIFEDSFVNFNYALGFDKFVSILRYVAIVFKTKCFERRSIFSVSRIV